MDALISLVYTIIDGRVTDIEIRPRILTFLHLRKTGQNTLIPLGLVFW